MIKILKHPVRFCISYKNKKYKIFSYFNAAKEGSFALHSYFKGARSGSLSFGKNYNDQIIDISKIEKENFISHKTNFHDSGMVSQKDKSGKSFSKNIPSKPFEKITDCINLFFLQPTTLNIYPEIDGKEYLCLDDEGKSILPPIIQGYLCHKSFDFQKEFIEKNAEGNYFIDEIFFSKFNLNLYIYVRKYKGGIFPSAEVLGIFKFD